MDRHPKDPTIDNGKCWFIEPPTFDERQCDECEQRTAVITIVIVGDESDSISLCSGCVGPLVDALAKHRA